MTDYDVTHQKDAARKIEDRSAAGFFRPLQKG
jgi:hypothetical protein